MMYRDDGGDGGAFGQAFQRQFKRSIGVPGEPSMAPEGQMGIAPLRGPKGGYRPPTPQAFMGGALQDGSQFGANSMQLARDEFLKDHDANGNYTGPVGPLGIVGGNGDQPPPPPDRYPNAIKGNPNGGFVPPGPHMDQNPDFPMTEDGSPWHPPALGEGRRKDYIPTENPVGLGYDPTSQNDMAGLALRGYYRDENNNWQMRPNPNRAPAPGRSNGRPMGAPPAPPPMPIPPGTGGLDPVGPGGGLGGPQGRDRMPGNFAAAPPQIKTPDNGWQWGDLNNLTNRWKG